jgi:DNA-directed RNA polymerase sigma subunit (sigma70/sigma32)
LNNSISCDAPSIADEEGSASVLDMIVDEASLIPFERVIESGYAEYSRAIIEACMRSVLTPQEAEVIRDRQTPGTIKSGHVHKKAYLQALCRICPLLYASLRNNAK